MNLNQITKELATEYKRLIEVLDIYKEFECASDVRTVAKSLLVVHGKTRITLPCYESNRTRAYSPERVLSIICNCSPEVDINSIEAHKLQNLDSRRFEPIYIRDYWVKYDDFSIYLEAIYSAVDGTSELERWISFLEVKWPIAGKELKRILAKKTEKESETSKSAETEVGRSKEKTYLKIIGLLVQALVDSKGPRFGTTNKPNKSQIYDELIAPLVDEKGINGVSGSTFSDYTKRGLTELDRW
ncbi:hypothetical protein ACMXYO_15410 [Neptuniibacter sp. QD37_6]|uniref:hypothetical protein n=1 Tax=Neptuniibacter sp. QD37_6 TaxID=3398210 RepID=UPI0039F4790B